MDRHTKTAGLSRVRVGSPVALLALVPQLLGFVPEDSLVVIGAAGPRHEVRATLRYDLPVADDTGAPADIAAHATGILAGQGLGTAVAAGYGPEAAVGPVAAALAGALAAADITLREFLRVKGGRYWSLVCADQACCPAEGTPFSPIAAAFAGAAVAADRAALAARLAPADSESMRQATARAARAAAAAGRRAAAARGLAVTGALITRSRENGPAASDAEAAQVTVALRDRRVQDDAWARMHPGHVVAHQRLWADLTRRARPGYVAGPASLLAFTAWQANDGTLASAALDRALADAPRHSMALLLRQVIDAGALLSGALDSHGERLQRHRARRW